jgi:hypothetical protein
MEVEMSALDIKVYSGAAIGFAELIAIGAVIFAVVTVICARSDEDRARGSMIGIIGGVGLIALIQIGKPLFN